MAQTVGYVEPDPDRHTMYTELFELWNDIYDNLRADMARHSALVHKYSHPQPTELTGAGA
jgi:hypothetical protein